MLRVNIQETLQLKLWGVNCDYMGGLGGSLLRSFLVSGILLVQRHTTQNQFSAFGLRYEHYIRCYWQICSTGSCPVPLLRTALTLFVPTSWDGCIRQNLDSKVVVRVKRWPTRKKSLLILLSWLVSSNVRSSMLHGTETWPMTSAALHRLCRNDRAMIRWICGVKPSDDPSMDELHAKLGICDLAILVRERRLRWFGHVMRSNGEINRVRSRPVPGRKGPGRPKKTWEECVKQDLKVCGLSEAGTQDRLSWRSSVKNSRQEPTPSNGSLLQSMAAPPARRVLGMRTRSFNKTGFDWLIDWYIEKFTL